jgi:hypothetical protein
MPLEAVCDNNHIWYTSPGLSPSQARYITKGNGGRGIIEKKAVYWALRNTFTKKLFSLSSYLVMSSPPHSIPMDSSNNISYLILTTEGFARTFLSSTFPMMPTSGLHKQLLRIVLLWLSYEASRSRFKYLMKCHVGWQTSESRRLNAATHPGTNCDHTPNPSTTPFNLQRLNVELGLSQS